MLEIRGRLAAYELKYKHLMDPYNFFLMFLVIFVTS